MLRIVRDSSSNVGVLRRRISFLYLFIVQNSVMRSTYFTTSPGHAIRYISLSKMFLQNARLCATSTEHCRILIQSSSAIALNSSPLLVAYVLVMPWKREENGGIVKSTGFTINDFLSASTKPSAVFSRMTHDSLTMRHGSYLAKSVNTGYSSQPALIGSPVVST